MADAINPYDVGALERAVNDSAGRVSGIWLSFVAFSAYLAAAASMISHRQIFLEEPIKLPTVNIDLPLVASAILLPLLFVIYHTFVLLQVVLLARTADAYNQAVERDIAGNENRTLVRQRLANTLFAQLFAGSPREREGVLGWLLRLMAWITLAIAPLCVLVVFEIKFLPYHSALITWAHRGLIASDALAVLILWAASISPANDIKLASLRPHRKLALGGAVIVLLSCFAATFPGEPTRMWTRFLPMSDESKEELAECRLPKGIERFIPPGFDRLVLPGADFVDDEKLDKILKVVNTNKQKLYQSERTQTFRNRNLRCARFPGADLRHVDFAGTDLSGAILRGAHLEGATFAGSRLVGAILDNAQLQESSFAPAELPESEGKNDPDNTKPDVTKKTRAAQLSFAYMRRVQLQGANLEGADLEGVHFDGAKLRDARFKGSRLVRAILQSAEWQGAFVEAVDFRAANFYMANLEGLLLHGSDFHGADLRHANLQGAKLDYAKLQSADLSAADLQGADLTNADFRGAVLEVTNLQGAIFDHTDFRGASLYLAYLVAADFESVDFRWASLDFAQLQGASFKSTSLQGASLRSAQLQGASLEGGSLEGAFLDGALLQGASFSTGLTGVRIADAFLWRTQLRDPGDCLDANVVNPRFDRIWSMVKPRGARTLRPQEINSAIIEGTVHEASTKGVPVKRAEKLQADLMALLNAPADDDDMRARQKAWSDCAEATNTRNSPASKADFEEMLAAFLIDLACTVNSNRETDADRAFVVTGIHQHRIDLHNAGGPPVVFSNAQSRNVARAFLGLDGKPCPGAKGIDKATRAALIQLAKASPAN